MTTVLRSHDLSCPSCATRIEKVLARVEGVGGASARFRTGRIEVEHDPEHAPVERLIETLRSAGYESRVSHF